MNSTSTGSNPAPGFADHPNYRLEFDSTEDHLCLKIGALTIAESRASLLVSESKHHAVWYLPIADLHSQHLVASQTQTYCPFKGYAAYWSVKNDQGQVVEDVFWTYPEPFDECARLKDYASFYTNKVTCLINGEYQSPPSAGWQK